MAVGERSIGVPQLPLNSLSLSLFLFSSPPFSSTPIVGSSIIALPLNSDPTPFFSLLRSLQDLLPIPPLHPWPSSLCIFLPSASTMEAWQPRSASSLLKGAHLIILPPYGILILDSLVPFLSLSLRGGSVFLLFLYDLCYSVWRRVLCYSVWSDFPPLASLGSGSRVHKLSSWSGVWIAEIERYILILNSALNFVSSPSIYFYCQEHTNAHVERVYKYPKTSVITNQVWQVLRKSVTIFLLWLLSVLLLGLILTLFICCTMSNSPRSVLDSNFQCAALPICLEERSYASLENALRRTLAGRLLTERRPSVPNLTVAVSRLWNCSHRISCYDHGKCLYSFEFTFAPDVEKVVSGGPWYVNGDLLLISRMDPNQAIEQLPFSFTKLWVRCFDLPPKCFTKDYAEAIGNSLGKFCETDLPPEDPNEAILSVQKVPTVRKYLRVKFDFNLYGPLKSTQSIQICNSKKVVVAEHVSRLSYERLPHTCFRCGFLGHLMEGCTFEGPQLYGEWIRAEKKFRFNLPEFAIPKVISKEGLPSSSSEAPRVTQVSNMAELVHNMISDPRIVRADYSLARADGPLPSPKGKAPMVDLTESSSIIPYASVPPKENTASTMYGSTGDSIMGPIPSYLRALSSPMGSESILMESDEGHFVSYLNSIASHEDPYASNVNRCLFKPVPSVCGGSPVLTSPPVSSGAGTSKGQGASHISEVFKEEIRKLPAVRKRATGNVQTPRPNRGRQASTSDEPG